jgi:hypothetical protein
VGSAVNDTTRELGGALGVAIVGSLLTSVYAAKMGDFLAGKPVPTPVKGQIEQSLGYALGVGAKAVESGQRVFGELLVSTAKSAYVDGMHVGLLVSAAVALVGAVVAFLWLPARAAHGTEQTPAFDEAAGAVQAGDVSGSAAAPPPGTQDPATAEH